MEPTRASARGPASQRDGVRWGLRAAPHRPYSPAPSSGLHHANAADEEPQPCGQGPRPRLNASRHADEITITPATNTIRTGGTGAALPAAGSCWIDPGRPWQYHCAESFGSRDCGEMPTVEQFSCLTEAKVVIEDWRVDYNEPRPRPVLGDKSSARLARA